MLFSVAMLGDSDRATSRRTPAAYRTERRGNLLAGKIGGLLPVILVLVVACTHGPAGLRGEWQAAIDTVGDTITVRTLSGSVWGDTADLTPVLAIGVLEGAEEYVFGSIRSLAIGRDGSVYAYDRHARALRKYAADGTYLATFGREGSGPGEYRRPDGGLAVLPDGRVLLRDPGNTRINAYAPGGDYLSTWSTQYSFSTSEPLFLDTTGNSYAMQVLNPEAPPIEWQRGLVIRDGDGTCRDTVALPTWDYALPQLIAGANTQRVPFAPWPVWSVSPLGDVVAGLPRRYELDVYRPDGRVLRIRRRNWERVSVLAEERDEQRRVITAEMRQIEPGWRWDGPEIPAVKAPYHSLFIGADGRIWLQLHQRAHKTEVQEGIQSGASAADPTAVTWVEPVAFDVFEPDGTYLGFVRAPKGTRLYPRPVAHGDTVWAVVEGDLGVQQIWRLSLVLGHGARTRQ